MNVHNGCSKYRFPEMPKPGFRFALVVQRGVVGVLLALQEGGVQWAGCVGCC